ncbi:MAG: DUF3108 domain-containing protein [Bauldia sp.]|nr:DUF3108 domain-containing protein [Bauldia sp.]
MSGNIRRSGLGARLAAAAALATLGLFPAELSALETTTLKATYAIAIGTAVVGHANVESRFAGDSYAATITGSTGGVSRLVSDARARLSGSGHISGTTVLPATFNQETMERGFGTYVSMNMEGGRITNLVAVPSLSAAPDRVPVTARHKTGIVDPLGAFIVPVAHAGPVSGRTVCNRTINVFDGWTRFNVELFYKQTKAVDGGDDKYAGRIIVCGAHYVPVAGHRSHADSLNDLVDNDRLEVWLAPVEKKSLLVPYRILIGTRLGDVVVYATRFTTDATEERAAAD